MQNEKRKALLEHESAKLKECDESLQREMREWKSMLMPRKQVRQSSHAHVVTSWCWEHLINHACVEWLGKFDGNAFRNLLSVHVKWWQTFDVVPGSIMDSACGDGELNWI